MKSIKRQSGVTSIEYGLLAALIAIVILGALTSTGGENGSIWDRWTGLIISAIRSP